MQSLPQSLIDLNETTIPGAAILLKALALKSKAAKRLGAFKCACEQGASIAEARAYSDHLYPPTAEDIAYEERLRQGESFAHGIPWLSAVALLYTIGVMIYLTARTPAPFAWIVGSGLANIGYLLFAAGIFSGKFGVFGLTRRWQVIAAAVTCFAIGTLLSNVGT